jgi:hypothetical protein
MARSWSYAELAGICVTTRKESGLDRVLADRRRMSSEKTAEHPVDLPRIEKAVKEILAAVGEDPKREGLLETPAREARMNAE